MIAPAALPIDVCPDAAPEISDEAIDLLASFLLDIVQAADHQTAEEPRQ